MQYNKDAFGLMETSSPSIDFEAQLTYDEQPLLFEKVLNNGLITYDSDLANLIISNNSLAGNTFVQTYEHFHCKVGVGKKVFIGFNFKGVAENNTKYVQFGDGGDAIGLRLLGSGVLEAYINSSTDIGNQTKEINRFENDIDFTKEQLLVIQFDSLYVGLVKIGLQLNGKIVWLAEFENANKKEGTYVRSNNFAVRAGINSTATTLATMTFSSCSVQNMNGGELSTGYDFQSSAVTTVPSGVLGHALSIRPKALFKTKVNRVEFINLEVSILVTGANSVRWQLVLGQALDTPVYADVNSDHSAMEFVANATLGAAGNLVVDGGTILANNKEKGNINKNIGFRYPISLNAAGLNRDLGTLTLLVFGVGGTSTCESYINWREVR